MAENKPKILIIEDEYRQYQIVRNLLQRDYEIFHNITTKSDFNALKAQLMRLLKDIDTSFQETMEDYQDVSAFVVDYELKEDSRDKTGILFCKKTSCISNGTIPILFLTKEPSSKTTNLLKNAKKEIPNIVSKFSRKPDEWKDEDKTVDEIVSNTVESYNNDIRDEIDEMLEPKSENVNNDYDID